MNFAIRNRWTGAVQFECELCAEVSGKSYAFQLGFAVKKARDSGADLSGADLRNAVLRGADLSGADLRSFKADLWMTLTQNAHEVPALIDALRGGRVDGSTYQGSCACLVGTIANARGVSHEDLEHNADNPAEQWFAMIHAGDKPGDDTGGGFASAKALEWTLEWCSLSSIEVSA